MLLCTLDVNCVSFINPFIKHLKRLANGCHKFGAVGDIKDTLFGVRGQFPNKNTSVKTQLRFT